MKTPLKAFPPKTAPQMTKTVKGSNYVEPPQQGRVRPKTTLLLSYEETLALQYEEARVKAILRARRTTDPTYSLRTHNFQKHRERVMSAKAVVDSRCPNVVKNLYVSPTHFNRKIATFVRIEKENAVLARRIAGILEGKATIDNRLKPLTKNINNRARVRQSKLLRTTFDNLSLLKRIQEQKPTYSRKQQLADFDKSEMIMSRLSYYPLFWKIKQPKGWEKFERRALANANANPRPLVFLDCGTEKEQLGRFVIELRADIVPMSAENFRCLCTGQGGTNATFKCSQFNRVIPGILAQGGDISGMKGYGSNSIYGETFPDENFKLKHSSIGVVSMANCGKNTNGCQFLIDARPLPVLDGVNVVVGKVIGGLNILQKMMDMVGPSGRTRSAIWIYDCGQLGSIDEVAAEDEGEEVYDYYGENTEE